MQATDRNAPGHGRRIGTVTLPPHLLPASPEPAVSPAPDQAVVQPANSGDAGTRRAQPPIRVPATRRAPPAQKR